MEEDCVCCVCECVRVCVCAPKRERRERTLIILSSETIISLVVGCANPLGETIRNSAVLHSYDGTHPNLKSHTARDGS